ncbi:MAG TPA: RIP metalloprotease RseP, partial [Thermomicrobiales bacterium]|nr:RIP metalloprotease RseP [Thermomicrobiales bacterium]
ILIHELGHFVSAKLVGIRVEEFGIGIPPRLYGIRKRGVLYSINLLPIGGFVRVLGEDGKSFSPDSLQAKSKLQRALFFAAGSLMNFLLAFVLMIALVGARGESTSHAYLTGIQSDSPAAQAGWKAGDRIVSVAGQPVSTVQQVVDRVNARSGQPVTIELMRGNRVVQSTVTPRLNPPPGQGKIGIELDDAVRAHIRVDSSSPNTPASQAGLQRGDVIQTIAGIKIEDAIAYRYTILNHAGETIPIVVQREGHPVTLSYAVPASANDGDQFNSGISATQMLIMQSVPWWKIVPRGVTQTFDTMNQMFHGLVLLVRGDVPIQGIAGPIGMGQITSEVLQSSPLPKWVTLSQIAALLSLNLAILNLLPLPALDGGRLLFVIIEMLRGGKRVAPEREGIVHLAGLVILLGLMFVIAFLDVGRLLGGGSFLP